ncbi:cytochrome c biogenesis protein CcsA [Robertmurraya sp. DFI.2.37]|uniref:cytochrome c biogenesis protein n=1 Tax=Robertmurraya sp. DFI.2.37 TaxID=3031819 RepID=UPI001244C058|nr:cytochrome c biogenesis protein CcsA [Robertmurraya sp. DFI.2.37]MDF1506803.1 cytochrome c biogenesis protein CcsA [Robertmurraya sp. DFI.2.37]
MRQENLFDRILLYILIPSVFILLYLIFIWSPVEKIMGETQKIFYIHVGTAWVAFLAFFVVGFYSVWTLIKPNMNRYIYAGISAEIGVVFTTITLLSGMTWGRASWNTWWSWEPRLVTTLILLFIYVAYLFIRKMDGSWEKIAKLSSVFGIIGCLNVPIVFMAIRWWNSKLHPVVFGEGKNQSGGGIEPEMLATLLFSVFTITVLYVFLMRKGAEIDKMRNIVKKSKNKLINKLAG